VRVCVCCNGSKKEEMEVSKVESGKVGGEVEVKESVMEGLSVKKWVKGEGKNNKGDIEMKKEWVEKVNSLGSVSDKVRFLNSVGLGKGDISVVLGIRFNWVYNILRNVNNGGVVNSERKIVIVE
jgi:hypothetical protein